MTGAPTPEAVRKFAIDAGLTQVSGSCDAELLQGQSKFWRIVSSRRGPAGSSAGRDFEHSLHEAALVQQLSCYPASGLAWADLASLTVSRDGWDDRSARYLALSQRYAPHEGEALMLRLQLLAERGGAADGRLKETYVNDLGTALAFGSPQLAASALSGLSGQMREWADDRLQDLPEPRRQMIEGALRDLTKTKVD